MKESEAERLEVRRTGREISWPRSERWFGVNMRGDRREMVRPPRSSAVFVGVCGVVQEVARETLVRLLGHWLTREKNCEGLCALRKNSECVRGPREILKRFRRHGNLSLVFAIGVPVARSRARFLKCECPSTILQNAALVCSLQHHIYSLDPPLNQRVSVRQR